MPTQHELELSEWRHRQLSFVEASLELALAAAKLEQPPAHVRKIGETPKNYYMHPGDFTLVVTISTKPLCLLKPTLYFTTTRLALANWRRQNSNSTAEKVKSKKRQTGGKLSNNRTKLKKGSKE